MVALDWRCSSIAEIEDNGPASDALRLDLDSGTQDLEQSDWFTNDVLANPRPYRDLECMRSMLGSSSKAQGSSCQAGQPQMQGQARARSNVSPLASLRDWHWSQFPVVSNTLVTPRLSSPQACRPPAPRSTLPTPRTPVVRAALNRCKSCCSSRRSRSRNTSSSCVDIFALAVHPPRLAPLFAIPGQRGSSLRPSNY